MATNYIEKMYELAEVEKLNKVSIHLNKTYNFEFHETDTKSDFYPPFTDTKQLELIKWIATQKKFLWDKFACINNEWFLRIYIDEFCIVTIEKVNTVFSQALAGLVCELWEDLTDEKREEIKEVLIGG